MFVVSGSVLTALYILYMNIKLQLVRQSVKVKFEQLKADSIFVR